MPDDKTKKEQQLTPDHAANDASKGREKIEPLDKEETMEEKQNVKAGQMLQNRIWESMNK